MNEHSCRPARGNTSKILSHTITPSPCTNQKILLLMRPTCVDVSWNSFETQAFISQKIPFWRSMYTEQLSLRPRLCKNVVVERMVGEERQTIFTCGIRILLAQLEFGRPACRPFYFLFPQLHCFHGSYNPISTPRDGQTPGSLNSSGCNDKGKTGSSGIRSGTFSCRFISLCNRAFPEKSRGIRSVKYFIAPHIGVELVVGFAK